MCVGSGRLLLSGSDRVGPMSKMDSFTGESLLSSVVLSDSEPLSLSLEPLESELDELSRPVENPVSLGGDACPSSDGNPISTLLDSLLMLLLLLLLLLLW
uniref:(northern house mosquito) hypothetical protein n=1 Tax=Culex pipiens TaxID=7175 RepID=A0A8D8FXQ3_CULPI